MNGYEYNIANIANIQGLNCARRNCRTFRRWMSSGNSKNWDFAALPVAWANDGIRHDPTPD